MECGVTNQESKNVEHNCTLPARGIYFCGSFDAEFTHLLK